MPSLQDRGRLNDISAFEEEIQKTSCLSQLSTLLDNGVQQFGFRWFAMIHNVDLRRRGKNTLMLTTYPKEWISEIIEARLYLDDPVHVACSRSLSGFSWDRIGDYIQPTSRQTSMLKRGRAHGLKAGFTMPIRMAHEPDALFTVARQHDSALSREDILTARLIGTSAYDHARMLLGNGALAHRRVHLSPRQIDCVALVAQGKSDWEIGQILGLSKDTVHEYIEAARKRYGVRRRTQLVLRAIHDGHLSIGTLV